MFIACLQTLKKPLQQTERNGFTMRLQPYRTLKNLWWIIWLIYFIRIFIQVSGGGGILSKQFIICCKQINFKKIYDSQTQINITMSKPTSLLAQLNWDSMKKNHTEQNLQEEQSRSYTRKIWSSLFQGELLAVLLTFPRLRHDLVSLNLHHMCLYPTQSLGHHPVRVETIYCLNNLSQCGTESLLKRFIS